MVSNFDDHGKKDGISIVVSPKKSKGMANDGTAHVVEYFDVSDIHDLPKAIQSPIVVFNNTKDKDSGKVILVELKKDGRNFIVAIQTELRLHRGNIIVEVNKISTLFPKEARGVVNWINNKKYTNLDKEKALQWIGALRNHHGTELTDEELSFSTNIVKEFVNPSLGDRKNSDGDTRGYTTTGGDGAVGRAGRASVEQAVADVDKRTGGNTAVIDSNEVPADVVKKLGEGVKGYVKGGKAYVVADNCDSAAEAATVAVHESAGHINMRNYLGDKAGEFYQSVFDNVMSEADRAAWKKATIHTSCICICQFNLPIGICIIF